MQREPMKTIGGMSARAEIDARIAFAKDEARCAAFDEAIAFLGGSGFVDAAEALRIAAFEPQTSPEQA
jgi:hypothetical protein